MEGIERVSGGYLVNGVSVSIYSAEWDHTMDRVKQFEKKYPDKEEFEKKMITRLKRIKNLDKIYYTIAVLVERGHNEVAEMYDSRLVLETLTFDFD